MEKETARKFIPLVNDPEFYRDLVLYANYRIEVLRKELETSELTRVSEIQGQIKELRNIIGLRDNVLARAV